MRASCMALLIASSTCAAQRAHASAGDTAAAQDEAASPGLPFLFSVNATVGAAFGGATLPRTEGPDSGEGFHASVGGALVPLWLAKRVGLGLGVDFGFKYAGKISPNGSLEMRRFPLVPHVLALVHLGDGWYARAAGGLHVELAVKWYQGGENAPGLEQDLPTPVGWMLEGGMGYALPSWAVELVLRQTFLRYDISPLLDYEADASVDANNVALLISLHRTF